MVIYNRIMKTKAMPDIRDAPNIINRNALNAGLLDGFQRENGVVLMRSGDRE